MPVWPPVLAQVLPLHSGRRASMPVWPRVPMHWELVQGRSASGPVWPPVPVQLSAPHVPSELATIVGKAMERDPEHRYPNASALAEDLKRVRADTGDQQCQQVSVQRDETRSGHAGLSRFSLPRPQHTR